MTEMTKMRIKKRMTQEEVAKQIGVNRSTVAMWETGKNEPRAKLLPKLAELFGCTVDELLKGEGE